MNHIKGFVRRGSLLTMALALFGLWAVADVFLLGHADAAQITSRKMTLSSSANGNITTGAALSGTNGAKTKHTFDFTTSGASVGSIEFQYCTTPLPGTTCTAPTGLDASTVTTIGGTSATGWSLGTAGNAPTASRIRITHTAAAINTVNFAFGTGSGGATDYIKNPTTDNTSFFVRITTFSDTAWTTSVDQGTVANATADQIDITAKVQETLNFSVGSTFTAPTASCVALTNANLPLGSPSDGVLDFTQAYDAHSYFRLSTNANGGTVIYYSGDTLKNGSNTISAIGTTATASAPGTSQFGLGIDSGDTNHSFTNLASTSPYNQANGVLSAGTTKFAFSTASVTAPAQIASAAGTVTCDTGSVRYLGNISTTTPPGIYTTTISYLAVPTY
ncbi:MAG TPA: hypothetical protein VFT16_04650 [Candidatus Saccharimonadales bacterium]|nr:hypothetical protein [Candidatus Saccharimonadales bacterium]